MEIPSTFHVRVEYISVRKIRHSAHSNQWGVNAEKSPKQLLPLVAHEPPSNTWMPGPSPLNMPNDRSIGSRTSAKLCNKVPIGYNGMPQIHPQNCPFPFDDHHPHLIHLFLDRPLSPPQTAFRSTQPFCQCTLSGQTDQQTETHWPIDGLGNRSITWALMLTI